MRPEPEQEPYTIEPQGRFWAVYEHPDQLLIEEEPPERRLICLCVYKVGAQEVKRRLASRVVVRTRQIFWKQRGEDLVHEEEDADE